MSPYLHLYLSFNPDTFKVMAASNASAATLEPNEPEIPKQDAKGMIEAIRKSGGSNVQNLPTKTQPIK